MVDEEDEDEEAEAGACPARRGGEKVVTHVVCPLHYYKYDLASGRCHEGCVQMMASGVRGEG